MAVSDMEALEILDLLTAVGARPWVAGGWGVDALAERQTRVHRDLDLMIRADRLDACLDVLRVDGFRVSADRLPVRVELDDGVRVVDLHPVHDDPDDPDDPDQPDDPDAPGATWQARPDGGRWRYPAESWVGGLIGGRTVLCASPALQLQAHAGYPPRDEDRHDLALLAEMLTDGPEGPEDA